MSAEEFQIDRRLKLDGGLNARAESFGYSPDQAALISNFALFYAGALTRRSGGNIDVNLDQNVFQSYASVAAVQSLSVAQVVGGGAFPAGTYSVSLVFRIRTGGQATGNFKVGNTLTYVGTVNLNDAIKIAVLPTNKGGGVGKGAGLVDDPFMGGYVAGEVEVYCKKSTDPNYTLQAGGAVAFTWNTATKQWEYTITAYTTNGAVRPGNQLGQGPVRKIQWWGEFSRAYYFMMDTVFCFNSKRFYAPIPMTNGVDKTGNPFFVSRLPTPISMAFVSRVPIFTDGFYPKKISDDSVYNSDGSGTIRLLGANPPDGTPLGTDSGVAGVLNGAYQWKTALVYRNNRPTGFPTSVAASGRAVWDSESNASLASSLVGLVNKRATVTLNMTQGEGGLQFIRLYRTKAGGTTFYKVADIAAATLTSYVDNIADAALDTTKTPVDDIGKDPGDLPPQQLLYLTEHLGYAWGVTGMQVVTTEDAVADRVMGFVGTNIIRISKYMLLAGQSDESTVDHWPNLVSYTVVCGGTSRITALLSLRGQLYVFKEDEIGAVVGDSPGNFAYRVISSGVGAMPQSVVAANGIMYFWHPVLSAMAFDGSTPQQVGLNFQYAWITDRQAHYWCYNAFYDQHTNQVKWYFSNMPMDPFSSQVAAGQANAAAVRGTWKEFTLYIPTGAMGVDQGTSYARNAMAAAIIDNVTTSQNLNSVKKTISIGNTEGRIIQDYTAQTDAGVAIAAYVQFPFFYGLPELVKLWRQLHVIYQMGTATTGAATVSVQFAQDDSMGSSIFTLAAAHGDRTEVIDVPKQPNGLIENDRAFAVRIDSTVNTNFAVKAIIPKWRDGSSVRKEVR